MPLSLSRRGTNVIPSLRPTSQKRKRWAKQEKKQKQNKAEKRTGQKYKTPARRDGCSSTAAAFGNPERRSPATKYKQANAHWLPRTKLTCSSNQIDPELLHVVLPACVPETSVQVTGAGHPKQHTAAKRERGREIPTRVL